MENEYLPSTGMSPAKRKRISVTPSMALPAVEDPLEYKKNKCTERGRKILTTTENINIDLWYDKHYVDREQFGDENGKREGIDNHLVEALVRKALKHLVFYSCFVKNFIFINREPKTRALRITLSEVLDEYILNVVIETHFISIISYEITVITAMSEEEFNLSDGQYFVEINGDNSTLFKMDNKKRIEVCSL
jgi:hypothetical protein